MNMRKHSDLRQLALAYYRGWIPRQKYINLRQEFLAAISEGKPPRHIDKQELAPPKKKPDQSLADTDTAAPSILTNNKTMLIAGAAVVLVAIIFSVLFLSPGDKETSATGSQVSQQQSRPESGTVDTPESRFSMFLQTTFIQNQEWNSDKLNILKYKWQGLSQEEQTSVRNSEEFPVFSSTLINMIVEERNQDNIVPSDKELMLMTAARNMGLLELLPDEQQ